MKNIDCLQQDRRRAEPRGDWLKPRVTIEGMRKAPAGRCGLNFPEIRLYSRHHSAQRFSIAPDTGRLAIISEDETAYGAIGANAEVTTLTPPETPNAALYECIQFHPDGKHGPLNLYYPRDIAALRSPYEKQSLLEGQTSGRTGLPETLSESDSSEHDTIRSYGGEQSPESQESELLAIVNLLKAHRIEFRIVTVRAS